jgi:glycosyltransferase involved in cell wall biosynthesis
LRVLIALNSFETDGPGLLVARVCERLARREGLNLEVVALSRGGPLQKRLAACGVRTYLVKSRGLGGLHRLRRWAQAYSDALGGTDVVHTHLPWPDVAMRQVHSLLGQPRMVSTCHGMHAIHEKGPMAGTAWRWAEWRSRKLCDAWIAVSVAVQLQLLEYGIDHWKTEVIPNGIDVDLFSPLDDEGRRRARRTLGLPTDVPIIGCAGTLRLLKGQDVLLRAFAHVYRKIDGAVLALAGEGTLAPRLERLAEELRVSDRIRLVGKLDEDQLPLFHGSLDVAVQPSRHEAFGMAIAEAQSCGVPAVASDVGGLREVVAHGETGLLVPMGDHHLMAEALLDLLADSQKRREMGARARERVMRLFPLDRTAERTYQKWRSLA